jgi:hypothetical protein
MTSQTPETLIYEGIKYNISEYMLEQVKPKIEFHPLGSFCWRGYRGTWEIRSDQLYLVDLIAWRRDPDSGRMVPQIRVNEDAELFMGEREDFDYKELGLKDVFPESPLEGIFADWFTGEISIPWGESHANKQYKKFLVFEFMNGKIKSKSIKSYEEVIRPFDKEKFI